MNISKFTTQTGNKLCVTILSLRNIEPDTFRRLRINEQEDEGSSNRSV